MKLYQSPSRYPAVLLTMVFDLLRPKADSALSPCTLSPEPQVTSPVGHAVLDVPLEEGHRIRVRISASLKRERNQCAVREIVGSCVFCYFSFVSSRGRGPCRPDGQGGAAPRGNRVRDDKVPKIIYASQTHGAVGASYRMVSGGS